MKIMDRGRLLLGAVLLLPLSSCFVAKQYERPAMQVEGLYRTDRIADSVAPSMDQASLAQVSWRNFFTDPRLQQYIQRALANNLDVRIALKNVDAAAAYVKQGKAAFWPTLNASAEAASAHLSGNGPQGNAGIADVDQFQLGAGLGWEADIWGKIRSRKRAYEADYLQTVEAHRAVQSRLVANVATMYDQLMALHEQIAITGQTVASRDTALTTTRALEQAGNVTAVATKQMEAQLYDAQLLLINLRRTQRVLENAFCILLNEPPHAVELGTMADRQVQPSLATGVPADLLANRPDVRQAEYALMEAFELTNVAKANFYPSLNITAAGGLQSVQLDNWFSANSLFSNVAANLLQPIVNRRQVRTAYEVAQSRQEQALLRYQQVLLLAGGEVSNALFDYQAQTEAVAVQRKQLEALTTAVGYSEQLLVNGLANYLEVLTARQSALAAQINLVNARYGRQIAIVDLYEALGGGWK
ncbi:MAG: efflux transporter outer membrane subunit [Flavobacteriales bacterium]|nr:efflux transporter outer membrane subunit [Flavobacteriales bacterium]